ncbi:MBL fold metallo-hydrolase [Rhodocytophaga aerolata]|uniref:MBL fold metallo-hydrolase n=1 Tax=Rhodocytophaga aerolata TaxID=455078 RepID=A0ABT8RB37_9BACT|nr:MBL fold metallo-hydrolase [Rhodocytophaga aerolata]MDO1447925.1 MBL fold metallo-hydrolase [Rhodocytophaga aerolata]
MNRRKLIRRVAAGGIGLAIAPSVYFYNKAENYMPTATRYTSNPELKTLLSSKEWPGTPLDQKGLFVNEEYVFWPKFADVLKWQTEKNPYKEEKKNDTSRLEVIKHTSPDVLPDNSFTWLGHASFLMKLNGTKILIDPVLESPSVLMKRYTDLPFPAETLKGMDYILVSHDHRDHCDETSIKRLAGQNPGATWLCGLSLDLLLKKWTGSDRIQAAGWYQQYFLQTAGLSIYYLPSRHWARRGLTDTNTTLWGAFLIECNNKKIYFGGDSGYGKHVGIVRELFGEVDYYLAGIGAFAPRWFMGPSHMHPEEAVRASNDLQPKNLLPMHYGTFDLSDEPLLEPARIIRQLNENKQITSKLLLPAVGQVVPV